MAGYRWSRSIAFGEVDWARILYYPRLFHFSHQAFEAFLQEALGMPYVDFLDEKQLGFPTVHVEADYEKPMPYGAELHFEVGIHRMGTRSMVVEYRVRTDPEGETHATVHITNVLVNMSDFSSIDIPDWVRGALEPYVGVLS